MQRTSIEWTKFSWNPIGWINKKTDAWIWFCTKVSPGCLRCYAERNAKRWRGENFLAFITGNELLVEPKINEDEIAEPLRDRKEKGGLCFVGDMTDLFHTRIPDQMIARVYAVMFLAQEYTFQVLTKRPERRRELLSWPAFVEQVIQEAGIITGWYSRTGRKEQAAEFLRRWEERSESWWPLQNVWEGTSVEDQKRGGRVIELLQTPAAVRFVSYEPALEYVDFTTLTDLADGSSQRRIGWDALRGEDWVENRRADGTWGSRRVWTSNCWPRIEQIIIGGESGPRTGPLAARPFDIGWARKLKADCEECKVPLFVKQFGSRPYRSMDVSDYPDDLHLRLCLDDVAQKMWLLLRHTMGGDSGEWPEDLRVRQFPASYVHAGTEA